VDLEYEEVVCSVCHGTGLTTINRVLQMPDCRAYHEKLVQARLPGRLLGGVALFAVVASLVVLLFYGH
jgi:hypothetical protein